MPNFVNGFDLEDAQMQKFIGQRHKKNFIARNLRHFGWIVGQKILENG